MKIVAKWLEEEETVDKRGCDGVVGNKLIIVSVYHMTRLSLIFSTGLGMTLQSQYCTPRLDMNGWTHSSC